MLGKSVGVTGTPTVYINGRRIQNLGLPFETLKQLVEFGAKQGN
jgi:protein-disulfide isomerase